MPFLKNDLYLAQGDDKLVRGDWTSTVYKYDASSFYNWEQDNLPLYDLEERTEFNWEQLGYPTSSLTGLHLSVSDSSVDTTGPYQVFSSISAALNKLPRTLRFPVIIEVAVSGNLGNIDIQDFEFIEDGGLEIVNRGFAKILSGSGAATVWDTSAAGATSSITSLSSMDLSSTMGNTSSLATSTRVTSLHGTNFWNNWHRSFIRMADVWSIDAISFDDYGTAERDLPNGTTPDCRNNGITTTIKNTSPGFFTPAGAANIFSFSDYKDSTAAYDYNGGSRTNQEGFSHLTSKALRPSNMANLQAATDKATRIKALPTGFVYANSAQRITVKNCNGPLYIRGFVVDGNLATAATEPAQNHGVVNGIEIENSNVLLENCAVMRCSEVGLKITNSKVNLNRGFTSYRVYPLTDNARGSSTAYGMQANNSEITLSGAYDVSSGLPADSPYSFAHSPVGVQLNNSVLKTPAGGRGKDLKGDTAFGGNSRYNQLYLDTFLNTEVGLEANDSTIDFNHTLISYMNEVGIRLNNTTLKVSEIVCDHNNWCGLEGRNSTIEYYKTLHGIGNDKTSPNKALSFLFNGQHLDLENCVFKNKKFKVFNNLLHTYPFEIGSGGYRVRDGVTIPGVHLKNTKADFMQMRTLSGAHVGYSFTASEPVLGEAYYIDEGSNVKFMGCSGNTFSTRIEGADSSYDALLDSTPIYVDNSSKIEFNGPTILNKAGINVGANNNSIIKFAPHNTEGKLDVSSYALSDTNQHTRVEMQSFKSCLVADNGSTIEMKDCGDFNNTWSRSTDSYVTSGTNSLIVNSDYNANNANGTTLYTSGGYIQFYPNPITRGIPDVAALPALSYMVSTLEPIGDGLELNFNTPVFAPTDYSNYSWGGMCVRADKGSEVKVLNTHFPCGWQNASSIILDVSAGAPATTTCGKVYIWNIGTNSKLHMSHVSVSGNYPGDTEYHGPSGLYVSSIGGCGGTHVTLSAAPSSTPDTGKVSVLDSFGKHANVTANAAMGVSAMAARTSFDNKGPFRIYFSVNPMAHFLGYIRGGNAGKHLSYQASSNLDEGYFWNFAPSAVEIGEPLQELAQGYNPSRDCSTTDPHTVSSIYNQLGFQTCANPHGHTYGEPLSTTFFYASGMLDESYVSRIWLDDSAMNTFANAKNATKGTSGRPKLVSYYRAVNAKYGSSYTGDFGNTAGLRNGYGLGFRSPNIFDFNKDT